MDLTETEQRLREALATIPPRFRRAMLAVLTGPDADRARAIGDLYATRQVPAMAELLIDVEEDPSVRAVLVGMLREG